jgi:hypothetical protein
MYGKDDLVDEYVSIGGHAYRPDLKLAIFKFINTHLKNDPKSLVKVAKFEPIDAEKLRVFPTDADIPKDALNAKIDETFVPKGQVKLPEKGGFEQWRKTLLVGLRSQSFRAFLERVPPAKVTGGPFLVTFQTEVGIELHAQARIPKTKPLEVLNLFVVSPEFDVPKTWNSVAHLLKDPKDIDKSADVWLAPRGNWTTKAPPNFVERAHLLLGRSIDEQRVWDICAVARNLGSSPTGKEKVKIRIVGIGQNGILAVYAALLEPTIKEVIIINPPKSHMQGPTFLNVLRVLDIPEALGLLAPRKLTLIGANDPAFDRTAEIYKLAGAADKLTRK